MLFETTFLESIFGVKKSHEKYKKKKYIVRRLHKYSGYWLSQRVHFFYVFFFFTLWKDKDSSQSLYFVTLHMFQEQTG